MTFPSLVGATEIAAMLGVTRQRVQQLAGTPGFPTPIAVLRVSGIKIWREVDVERWAAERRGRVTPSESDG